MYCSTYTFNFYYINIKFNIKQLILVYCWILLVIQEALYLIYALRDTF